VERGNPPDAVERLSKIAKAFPHSSLARFYLAFSLKNVREREYDAKRYLREALALPDAEKTVAAWALNHPEFCPLLVEFVDAGIAEADEFAQKYDKDDPAREAALDSELRRPGYELFRQALLLAEKLDPASLDIQRLLATTEAMFGDYECSYRRLSLVMDALVKTSDTDENRIFFCRQLRGRVGFLWIEQQRDRGDKLGVQSIEFLEASLGELQICRKALDRKVSSVGHDLKRYRIRHDLLRATLTLAEIEMDLKLFEGADKRLRDSKGLMLKVQEAARDAGLDDSTITGLRRRLEEATNRRNSGERIASSR
jgi:hypothetical protein